MEWTEVYSLTRWQKACNTCDVKNCLEWYCVVSQNDKNKTVHSTCQQPWHS